MTLKATKKEERSLPTSNVLDYRVPLFPVSYKIAKKLTQKNTLWGSVKIEKGNPTAWHKDILDAIMCNVMTYGIDSQNRLTVIFDVVDVQKMLGVEIDYTEIRKKLIDLQSTVFSIKHHKDEDFPTTQSIIASVGNSKKDAPRLDNQFPAKLKKIVFSELATARLLNELNITINKPTMANIFKMKNQVSRALAKWCLTHSNNQNHDLKNILIAIGAIDFGQEIEGRAASSQAHKYRNQLKADRELLQGLGITINNTSVHYTRLSKTVFISE